MYYLILIQKTNPTKDSAVSHLTDISFQYYSLKSPFPNPLFTPT